MSIKPGWRGRVFEDSSPETSLSIRSGGRSRRLTSFAAPVFFDDLGTAAVVQHFVGRERREREVTADFQLPIVDLNSCRPQLRMFSGDTSCQNRTGVKTQLGSNAESFLSLAKAGAEIKGM